MDPFENEIWTHFDGIEKQVNNSIEEKNYCVGKKTKIPIQLFFCLVVALIKMFLNNYKDKTS
jgi:tetrahydromethanopterin S-methyltransferase subunit G